MKPPVPHVVYLCRDSAGALIYVGVTSHLGNRKSVHRSASPWWGEVASVEIDSKHRSFDDAHRRERFLIATTEPRNNKRHNPCGDEDARRWQVALASARIGDGSDESRRRAVVNGAKVRLGVTASAT